MSNFQNIDFFTVLADRGEPLNNSYNITQSNPDSIAFFKMETVEPISYIREYNIGDIDECFSPEMFITKEQFTTNVRDNASSGDTDHKEFQDLRNHVEEFLDLPEFEWKVAGITATEITDPSKLLPILMKTNVRASTSVSYQVQGNSSAANFLEYTMENDGNGTVTFAPDSGGVFSPVKNLSFEALTQTFAKPERYVYVKLINPVGSGTYWPRIYITSAQFSGHQVRIFSRYLTCGTDFTAGSDLEVQAQKMAAAWNLNSSYTFNSGWKATAVAVGRTVEFRIDTTIAITDSPALEFYTNSASMFMHGNLIGNSYYYLAGANRRDNWTMGIGQNETMIVTIPAHGARPGIATLLSYNATTRRMTRRAQVPVNTVSGLVDKLAALDTRLKNRGF